MFVLVLNFLSVENLTGALSSLKQVLTLLQELSEENVHDTSQKNDMVHTSTTGFKEKRMNKQHATLYSPPFLQYTNL